MTYIPIKRSAYQQQFERGGKTKSEKIVGEAFHEVHANKPAIVSHTMRKFGEADARRQEIAISLNKARRRGADV